MDAIADVRTTRRGRWVLIKWLLLFAVNGGLSWLTTGGLLSLLEGLFLGDSWKQWRHLPWLAVQALEITYGPWFAVVFFGGLAVTAVAHVLGGRHELVHAGWYGTPVTVGCFLCVFALTLTGAVALVQAVAHV